MIDVTPTLPEVVAEVRDLFERYERALVDRNVEVLDATFWDSPYTITGARRSPGSGAASRRDRPASPAPSRRCGCRGG